MAWEWSHAQEAYSNARQNVQKRDRRWLEAVYAEWKTWDVRDDEDDTEAFDQEAYEAASREARVLPDDTLADYVWERMEQQAICTNGGFMAHACPYGCCCHMVSFDLEDGDETEP